MLGNIGHRADAQRIQLLFRNFADAWNVAHVQRRKEFGIRIALGAQPGNILRAGISEGMKLAAAGSAIGLIAGVIINKRMTALLYEVEPTDLTTYCAITALLLSVAFVAAYLPARKALKMDPTTALKLE